MYCISKTTAASIEATTAAGSGRILVMGSHHDSDFRSKSIRTTPARSSSYRKKERNSAPPQLIDLPSTGAQTVGHHGSRSRKGCHPSHRFCTSTGRPWLMMSLNHSGSMLGRQAARYTGAGTTGIPGICWHNISRRFIHCTAPLHRRYCRLSPACFCAGIADGFAPRRASSGRISRQETGSHPKQFQGICGSSISLPTPPRRQLRPVYLRPRGHRPLQKRPARLFRREKDPDQASSHAACR